MANSAEGFDMAFTYRGSWKANISRLGKVIETDVPVTWTKGWVADKATQAIFLEVWYQDPAELQARAKDPTPFHVALGVAHDYSEFPHRFKAYKGLFEVEATGTILSDSSLQTKVIRRLSAE
jgi:hypothetical protein